jgi:methionyl-tRNA formyltransferase
MTMRVVFLGTPEFAVPSLHALVDADLDVPLVVSQPDRPRGRGKLMRPSPVRAQAVALGLPTVTLEKGGRQALYERILGLRPDVVVVVAFGHIVREPLLRGPHFGCVNVHASMLPRWRGPAPIHRAILAGDRSTGVCTMQLAEGVDTGDLYECTPTEIGPNETAGDLHDRLSRLGAGLLVSTLRGLEAAELRSRPQGPEGVSYAPMLRKEEGSTDFQGSAREVHDRIRGLDPWPAVSVLLGGKRIRLADSRLLDQEHRFGAPGTVLGIDEEGLRVACENGTIIVKALQAEGGRRMSPLAFARGHALEKGMRLRALPGFVGSRP